MSKTPIENQLEEIYKLEDANYREELKEGALKIVGHIFSSLNQNGCGLEKAKKQAPGIALDVAHDVITGALEYEKIEEWSI